MNNILLIDCNNFFVSCEQLLNPDLKGKAVCVLSNNDGCIVARSNEAKDMGISYNELVETILKTASLKTK